MILRCLNGQNNDLFKFFLDLKPSCLSNNLGEIPTGEHVALYFRLIELFGILLDGVVGEVHKLVADFVHIVLLGAETKVALLVEPYLGWVVVLH